MKVKEAIEQLKELDSNKEIILAYWEKDVFNVDHKKWNSIVKDIDNEFDWSISHDNLQDFISIWLFNHKHNKK